MKQAILLLMLLNSHQALGQFFEKNALYVSPSISIGNYLGAEANLTLAIAKKYSLQAGWLGTIRLAKNAPDDYFGGIASILSFGISLTYDFSSNFYVNTGGFVYLNRSKNLRFNFLTGISYSKIRGPSNWVESTNSGGFIGPNYVFEYQTEYVFGLNLNPRFEFVPIDYFGMSLSPLYIINGKRNHVGIGLSLMVGLVR